MIRKLALLSLALLCACASVPDAPAAYNAAPEPTAAETSIMTAEPIPARTVPLQFVCDFSTTGQSIRVTADAPIDVLSKTGAFPIVRVARRSLSDGERKTLVGRLLDSDTLYRHEKHLTRAMLAPFIEQLTQEPTPKEKADWLRETGCTEEDYRIMRRLQQSVIESYRKEFDALPETDDVSPLPQWDGSAPDADAEEPYFAIVRNASDTGELRFVDYANIRSEASDSPIDYQIAARDLDDVTVVWYFNDTQKPDAVRIAPDAYDLPFADAAITPNDAIAVVSSVFTDVCSFRAAEVFWSDNADGGNYEMPSRLRHVYLLRLTQEFEGANLVSCQVPAIGEQDSDTRNAPALIAAVDGDGTLISLDWSSPLTVTETVSASAELLSYAEIERIFQKQIDLRFADVLHRDGALTVENVQLGLFRTLDPDDANAGLLTPAWVFTGTFAYGAEKRADAGRETEPFDSANPILIINAVTGEVIDPIRGYGV